MTEITFDKLPEAVGVALGKLDRMNDLLESMARNRTGATVADYLTREEVATRYRISLVTLNEWTKSGKVQSYRICRRVLYKSDEIDAAIQNIYLSKGGKA